MLELIRTMTSDGQTVLMCTHLLLEAEGLADEIIILQHGTDLVSGRPDALACKYWPAPVVTISSPQELGLDLLARAPGVTAYDRAGDTATITLDRSSRTPELVAALAQRRVPVSSVVPFSPSLEDLYFAVRRESGSTGDEVAPPDRPSGRPARDHLPVAA